MLKWTKCETKCISTGYTVAAYKAEGVPAYIEHRKVKMGMVNAEYYIAAYKTMLSGRLSTLGAAKRFVESCMVTDVDLFMENDEEE